MAGIKSEGGVELGLSQGTLQYLVFEYRTWSPRVA